MKLYGKLDGEAITDISYNSKAFEWYDDFIKNFDIESDVVENMYPEDIAEQIKEVAGDKLVDYYTKYLKELQK